MYVEHPTLVSVGAPHPTPLEYLVSTSAIVSLVSTSAIVSLVNTSAIVSTGHTHSSAFYRFLWSSSMIIP